MAEKLCEHTAGDAARLEALAEEASDAPSEAGRQLLLFGVRQLAEELRGRIG